MYRRLKWILPALLVQAVLAAGCSQGADFSPDGQHLVFTWPTLQGSMGLVMIRLDGMGMQAVPGGEHGFDPLWSPDGQFVLFGTVFTEGTGNHLKMRAYDFKNDLVSDLAADVGPPFAWREDGWHLAGIHRTANGLSAYIYNRKDRGVFSEVPLPVKEVKEDASAMVWIPNTDGVMVIGDGDVYRVDVGQQKRLTTSGDVVGLGISADRHSIFWARGASTDKAPISLFKYDIGSGDVTPLDFSAASPAPSFGMMGSPRQVDNVVFSPDGKRLALVATLRTGQTYEQQAVYSFGFDGSDMHLVQYILPPHTTQTVSDANPDTPSLSIPHHLAPSWSRDGTQLAVYETGNIPSIHLYSPDGSHPRRLWAPVPPGFSL